MTQATEAQLQQELVQIPEAQRLLRQRGIRRVVIALGLVVALTVFLLWLPWPWRNLLFSRFIANRLLVGLLFLFGLMATSLLWSGGQRLDVWLFKAFNLRGYHAVWMDRLMWVATQIGNVGFAAVLAIIAYVLGDRRFTFSFVLGSLTLLLLVTILKALTDRIRPFNLMREVVVIGWREAGLSFPSGHTAQTFFMMTFAIGYFHLPLAAAAGL